MLDIMRRVGHQHADRDEDEGPLDAGGRGEGVRHLQGVGRFLFFFLPFYLLFICLLSLLFIISDTTLAYYYYSIA